MPADPTRAKSIFMAALATGTPAEREAYLTESCGGDAALRGRIEELLRANDAPGSFLDAPAVAAFADSAGPTPDDTRTGPLGPDANEPLDFLVPSDKPGSIGRLGHYEVQGVVGRGGMGVVLKAFDERLHRVVAVKVMAPQLAASAAARQRFTREARAAAAVTHEHVVTIHGVEEAGGLPYLVMQYVDGVSLQDRIDRTGPLRLAEVLRIGAQAASGLAAAHKQGLVHRDVKPANILLENGVERVKLTDFGLARAADDASLTQAGAVAGTPQYMSPEQAEGKPVDVRSDLFSLGSVLYAMCAGRPPFRGSTAPSVLRRVVETTPAPIREANPEVPDWLAEVVGKLHAKDPADRYQSAAEVADVLGRHLAHVQHPSVVPFPAVTKSVERPPGPERAARRNRWAVAAAVLVASLAVLGATEAAGVTNVRTTIVRVFTPDGTLVVETEDPDVKITVEGDGGLVVTGTGVQEIRLKPGSYRVQADRDGKRVPLERELVTVSRGGREVVRVKLEVPPAPAVAPKAEAGAFVLLAAGKEREFDTLAEAVQGAGDGDIIEVRGNGPFEMAPITLKKALTIRAGVGCRPHLIHQPTDPKSIEAVLTLHARIVLEGLTVERGASPGAKHWLAGSAVVKVGGAPFRIANCRIVGHTTAYGLDMWRISDGAVTNCEILSDDGCFIAIHVASSISSRLHVENSLLAFKAGGLSLAFINKQAFDELQDAVVLLHRNTISCDLPLGLHNNIPLDLAKVAAAKKPRLCLEATGNILVGRSSFCFPVFDKSVALKDAAPRLPKLMSFRDEDNLYAVSANALLHLLRDVGWDQLQTIKGLREWHDLWGIAQSRSQVGTPAFTGGDVVTKALADPGGVSPADFRLAPGSPGKGAGPGGKDLGADIDLVGPGTAYERWKKTPAYQQWLKETGQVKK